MKVLLTANTKFALVNFRKELIQSLSIRDVDLIFVCMDDQKIYTDESMLFESVNPSKSFIRVYGLIDIFRFWISYLFALIRYKPDVILSFTAIPNIISALSRFVYRAKLIVNVTGFGVTLRKSNRRRWLTKVLMQIMLIRADVVFVQNRRDF